MSSRRHDHTCIAVTRRGLEGVLAEELRGLGLAVQEVQPGAVAFTAPERGLYLAVRWSRVATRILVVVAEFRAHAFASLEHGLASIDWARWVRPGGALDVRARAHQATLYHTGAIVQRVEAAIADAGLSPSADPAGPPQRIDVRIVGERAQVRVDATGEPGDRPGWRRALAKAPLPPTVAAAALWSARWHPGMPLLDPMCGSGTIPIEAAQRAARRPPAIDRTFAVQGWPAFAPGTWASTAVPPPAAPAQGHVRPIVATDRDEGAVTATSGNAERAGVAAQLTVAAAPLSRAPSVLPDGPGDRVDGLVITNPPWGRRIEGDGDLRDLYASLGRLVGDLPGWGLALVTADDGLARQVGLPLNVAWRTRIAGETVSLHLSPELLGGRP